MAVISGGKLPKGFEIIGTTLRDYQLESFLFSTKNDNTGLLLDLGMGKTLTSITSARYRIQFDEVEKVLVVCPPSLLYHWRTEIEFFSEHQAIVLNATKKERMRRARLTNYKFSVINYESLFPLLRDIGVLAQVTMKGRKKIIEAEDAIERVLDLNYDMIIFDESARYLKNPDSQRTIAATQLADQATYKIILTGTLIGGKPLNLWPQFRVLDGGYTFGTNFFAFRHKYFDRKQYGNYSTWTLPEHNYTYFQKMIYQCCIRFEKNEEDYPERTYQTIELPLDGKLKDIYKEVQKKVLSEIETKQGDTKLEVNNILTKLLRLQQITSGYVSQKRGEEKELKQQPKLEALMEQIDTVLSEDESIVIWCRFTKSIDMISDMLKKKKIEHTIMDGRTKANEKYNTWKGFQRSESSQVFIGQVESGGLGVELFKIDENDKAIEDEHQTMIMYENQWSPDVKEQAQGRIHRLISYSKCRYIDLIIKDTIDERILESLNNKQEVADAIMKTDTRTFLTNK